MRENPQFDANPAAAASNSLAATLSMSIFYDDLNEARYMLQTCNNPGFWWRVNLKKSLRTVLINHHVMVNQGFINKLVTVIQVTNKPTPLTPPHPDNTNWTTVFDSRNDGRKMNSNYLISEEMSTTGFYSTHLNPSYILTNVGGYTGCHTQNVDTELAVHIRTFDIVGHGEKLIINFIIGHKLLDIKK